jgi:3-deoxy-manno-octulosonate cytidylyltransferase (CMP-KDO synthetase)
MIVRTAQSAAKASSVTTLVVATDSEEIARCVRAAGFTAMMTSEACANGTERVAEVAAALAAEGQVFDVVVNIQGDEPCVDPAHVDALVGGLLAATDGCLMACCAAPLDDEEEARSRAVTKVVFTEAAPHRALYFSRALIPSGKADVFVVGRHWRNCGMYAYTPTFLATFAAHPGTPASVAEDLEQVRALEMGVPLRVVLVDRVATGVDTEQQLRSLDEALAREEGTASTPSASWSG